MLHSAPGFTRKAINFKLAISRVAKYVLHFINILLIFFREVNHDRVVIAEFNERELALDEYKKISRFLPLMTSNSL